MTNLGRELAAQRKQYEKLCPWCGITYLGYAHAQSCKKCSPHARYMRMKAKKQNEATQ